MKREYGVSVDVGAPRVAYREAITKRADFDWLHKKQSGGQGQYARVVGYLEPVPKSDDGGEGEGGGGGPSTAPNAAKGASGGETPAGSLSASDLVFSRETVGNAVPPSFIPAVEKGFREAAASGSLAGHPVFGARVALTDGAAHAVDSSELAFKLAATYAFRDAYQRAGPQLLEPVMEVDVRVPAEFQGAVVGDVHRRKGTVAGAEAEGGGGEDGDVALRASVPLSAMFGYSTALRSMTQGKGEFTMEYSHHAPVPSDAARELIAARGKK